MKIPKITQLPSGSYFCRLRLNGQSIPITEDTEDLCRAKAIAIKTGIIKGRSPETTTLRQAIDAYLDDRYHVLSPSTIRGYRTIQRARMASVMDKPIGNVKSWQKAVDNEARIYAPKTVSNTWGLVKTVLADYDLAPRVKLPQKIPSDPRYLTPEQIPAFIDAITKTDYAIPALLALNSLRLSEIKALTWDDISDDFITVAGSVVPDEHNTQTYRRQNKTAGSTRRVPILIPELRDLLREKRGTGPLMPCHESFLRKQINKVCRQIGAAETSIHGLRHSFASLAYHLKVPVKIAMEIGGWSNEQTIHRIYTHIAQSDIERYSAEFKQFFAR